MAGRWGPRRLRCCAVAAGPARTVDAGGDAGVASDHGIDGRHGVDFVVVGFGVGALGVLLGLLARDAGSWHWPRPAAGDASTASIARRIAAGRASRAGGRVLALGGAVTCLATLLALLLRLSDRAGALLVLAALVLATAGAIVWAAVYSHRYHPRPLKAGASRAAAKARNRPRVDRDGAPSTTLPVASSYPPDPESSPGDPPWLGGDGPDAAAAVTPIAPAEFLPPHDRAPESTAISGALGFPRSMLDTAVAASPAGAVEPSEQGEATEQPGATGRDRGGEDRPSRPSEVTQRLTTVGSST